jgi:hypothetical protein
MKTTDDWLWAYGDHDHFTCSTTSRCSADNKLLQRSVVPVSVHLPSRMSDCLSPGEAVQGKKNHHMISF